MPSIRKIKVGKKEYLQVVEYTKGKAKVLKSFGKDSLETRGKAIQFVENNYALIKFVKEGIKNKEKKENIEKIALTVFGSILGGALVMKLLEKYLEEKKNEKVKKIKRGRKKINV